MREMMQVLQLKADLCGALILSFELSDLQYDASIASGSESIVGCVGCDIIDLPLFHHPLQCLCASRPRLSLMLAASL